MLSNNNSRLFNIMLQIIEKIKNFVIIFFLLSYTLCGQQTDNTSLINMSHLDYLYEDIEIEGKPMGIIHIYSNYPDYKWIDDSDEGTACVDDGARAAVFYLKFSKETGNTESIRKATNLLEFIIYMQSENGYLYNFIWRDGSINKEYKTSVNEPNWWTWRGLWALMEGYEYFKNADTAYAKRLLETAGKIAEAVKKNIPAAYDTLDLNGFKRPAWLPFGTASDQAALMIIGLSSYYEAAHDIAILGYCRKLAEGIILMQEGDKENYPYGAFLSWENTWHGWGNSQAYALLKLYEITKDESYNQSALKEIDNFHDYLITNKYITEFAITKKNHKISPSDEKKFSQIAYMIRPLIYSAAKAYKITGDSAYAEKAARLALWFFGENPANAQMYSPENGKCFDGIHDENMINKNSGAESTIEALLSLSEIESNSVINQNLKNLLKENE